ncbi:MAG: family 14 glycosylhydrolase [Desulfuromonadaceae bacterium]
MIRLFRILICVLLLVLPVFGTAAPLARPAVWDWGEFQAQLQQAKGIGVTAVSTDVWWGKVEAAGDQQFDWSYYDRVSDAIIQAGLKWVPIFSFHQCGGNVGDSCDIPLPNWVWGEVGGGFPEELKYQSEQGNLSSEVIALWADDRAARQYREFVRSFAEHFGPKAGQIEEINISAGPSGELRYPSYNQHDGFNYPARGFLQAYSNPALADFIAFAESKYGTLENLNAAWNTQLAGWGQVRPPSDANGFFGRKDYLNIPYGRDFTEWYNGALVEHGRFMIELVTAALHNNFPGIPLGIKIPGVHWQMVSPDIPRSAEVSAGLIPTHIDLFSDATGHGYAPIIDMVQACASEERPVVLHFTCLEMDNNPDYPQYSQAKDLVFWVARGAADRGVAIMGENALSGGLTNDHGWDNIDNALRWSSYVGLTTLRIGDLSLANGLGYGRYQKLINDFQP